MNDFFDGLAANMEDIFNGVAADLENVFDRCATASNGALNRVWHRFLLKRFQSCSGRSAQFWSCHG
jgi:hypothetical protein